jgi:hypothetical protein
MAALAIAALAVFAHTNSGIDVDDAYISYRYMENLARTGEAVYNLGDRVYGSTAMLWVFLVALVCRITGSSAEHAANIFTAALTAANVALMYALVRFNRGSALSGLLAAGALLSFPLFALVSTLGMETTLVTCLTLLCFHAFARNWFFRAGVASGLLFMTRPDAVAMWLAMIGIAGLGVFRKRSRPTAFRELLWLAVGFFLIAIPFMGFCAQYYGTVLPNTLSAKRAIPLYVAGRWWMRDHFLSGPGFPVSIAVAVGCVWLAVRRNTEGVWSRPTTRLFGVAALWLLAYALAWSWTGIDKYIWYVAAMAAPSTVALVSVALLAAEQRPGRSLILSLVLLTVVVWWGREARNVIGYWNGVYVEAQEMRRKALGMAISKYTVPTEEVLTTGAIGIIGYNCGGCYLVDVLGLVTPLARAASYPAPTLMYISDETGVPPDFQAAYWSRQAASDGQGSLLLTSRTRASSWDPERIRPAMVLNAAFGSATTLVGVNPIRREVAAGQSIQFEAQWKFAQPLLAEQAIVYSVGRQNQDNVASLDAKGFFAGRRSFQDVRPGEAVLDTITIPITAETPAGVYTVSASIRTADASERVSAELMTIVVR